MHTKMNIAFCCLIVVLAPAVMVEAADPLALRTEMTVITNATMGVVTFVKHFRGDEMIYHSMVHTNGGARSVYFDSELRFSEEDRDGDGFFETIWLDGESIESPDIFIRTPEGAIEPADAETLREVRKSLGRANERAKLMWNTALKQLQDEGEDVPALFFWKEADDSDAN